MAGATSRGTQLDRPELLGSKADDRQDAEKGVFAVAVRNVKGDPGTAQLALREGMVVKILENQKVKMTVSQMTWYMMTFSKGLPRKNMMIFFYRDPKKMHMMTAFRRIPSKKGTNDLLKF